MTDSRNPNRDDAPLAQPGAVGDGGPAGSGTFPQAKVRRDPWSFVNGAAVMWLVAAASVMLAMTLVWKAREADGPTVVVAFEQGHGIAAEDPVRLRGIDVGEVRRVVLAEDLKSVRVELTLTPEARSLAREGSRFWIERPRVQLGKIGGLDTLIGPKYVGVDPGAGPPVFEFQGVPSPRQFTKSESIGITVRFRRGHGISVGAPVRFRGVQVGEVVDVELSEQLGHVRVHAELQRSADRLAAEGAQFWIERPKVSVAEVRGLDTLLGGAYLAVLPSAENGEPQLDFDGLDVVPAEDQSDVGIEVILESPARFGLKAGSPLTHRGVAIGTIVRVGLASDGASVEARALIRSAYQELVRDNSRFWRSSGVSVDISVLTGVELTAESLETIASGGAAMATPDEPGPPVATGHRFALAEQPDDAWLQWRPQLAIGRALLPPSTHSPPCLRATLRWSRRSFGFQRERQRQLWLHAMPGGRLVCPWDDELPEGVGVEFAGKTIELPKSKLRLAGAFLLMNAGSDVADGWPKKAIRTPSRAENCVLMAGPDTLPVSAGRLRPLPEDPGWRVELARELDGDWDGASVVAQEDGKLIGMLRWDDGDSMIVPVTRRLAN